MMRIIRSLAVGDAGNYFSDGCALTIGNFDAVHLGHRDILRMLVTQAARRKLPATVMTFDPHPQEYFARVSDGAGDRDGNSDSDRDMKSAPSRLTTTATRFFALRDCGVDCMLSLKFNRALASTNAEQFVRDYLVRGLNVKYLLVGDDFRFGARRAGNFQLLARLAKKYNYELHRCDTVQQHDRRISSTWIRKLLADGALDEVEKLLGGAYQHTGRVIHGAQRGRQWGFPTLNLAIRHRPALTGIFAVRVAGIKAHKLAGVASLGVRPTLNNAAQKYLLEVHLFDYDGDAYGRRICVEFVKKIRDEEKFADYESLKKQIANDAHTAKIYFDGAGKMK